MKTKIFGGKKIQIKKLLKEDLRNVKKFGFKRVARIPKQIQYKGKLIDEIVMLKEL